MTKPLFALFVLIGCGGDVVVITETDGGGSDSGALDSATDTADAAMDEDGSMDTDAASPCGHPAPSGQLFWTTLDDAEAISNPRVGNGTDASFATIPAGDFAAGTRCDGLRIDENGEHLEFTQLGNVDWSRGTLEFAYLPDADHTDDLDHMLFTASNFGVRGGLVIRKAGAANANGLQVLYIDDTGALAGELEIASDEYAFRAGEWVLLRFTWDFTVAAGAENVQVYIDGARPSYTPTRGPVAMPTASAGESFRIGVRNESDEWFAGGVIDEVMIWGEPRTP